MWVITVNPWSPKGTFSAAGGLGEPVLPDLIRCSLKTPCTWRGAADVFFRHKAVRDAAGPIYSTLFDPIEKSQFFHICPIPTRIGFGASTRISRGPARGQKTHLNSKNPSRGAPGCTRHRCPDTVPFSTSILDGFFDGFWMDFHLIFLWILD